MTLCSLMRSPRRNRSYASGVRSRDVRPSTMSSAIASPAAGACMMPCPENPVAQRSDRKVDTGEMTDLGAPGSGSVHDGAAGDRGVGRLDRGDAVRVARDADRGLVFAEAHALLFRAHHVTV